MRYVTLVIPYIHHVNNSQLPNNSKLSVFAKYLLWLFTSYRANFLRISLTATRFKYASFARTVYNTVGLLVQVKTILFSCFVIIFKIKYQKLSCRKVLQTVLFQKWKKIIYKCGFRGNALYSSLKPNLWLSRSLPANI